MKLEGTNGSGMSSEKLAMLLKRCQAAVVVASR
jgi:hypothetical protein